MAYITPAIIIGEDRGKQTALPVEFAGVAFDFPGLLRPVRIERPETTDQIIFAPTPQPGVPRKPVPFTPSASIVVMPQQPIRRARCGKFVIVERMPVGVVQCPQPNLQNLIVLFQDVQRLFDETGCCEFPIILAVKDEFRAHFLVGFVDSGNLPDPLTRGEPCKRQIVILPCEMLILRSVAIFENHYWRIGNEL